MDKELENQQKDNKQEPQIFEDLTSPQPQSGHSQHQQDELESQIESDQKQLQVPNGESFTNSRPENIVASSSNFESSNRTKTVSEMTILSPDVIQQSSEGSPYPQSQDSREELQTTQNKTLNKKDRHSAGVELIKNVKDLQAEMLASKSKSMKSKKSASSTNAKQGSGDSQRQNNDSGQSGCQDSQELNDQGNVTPEDDIEIIPSLGPEEDEDEKDDKDKYDLNVKIQVDSDVSNLPANNNLKRQDQLDVIFDEPRKLRKSVKADIPREMTFQNMDQRIQHSKTILAQSTQSLSTIRESREDSGTNYVQTFGRDKSETTTQVFFMDDFEGYDQGIIKSGSQHKKRKSKKNIDSQTYGNTGFGCCGGFQKKQKKVSKNTNTQKPIESPMMHEFKKRQVQKLDNDGDQQKEQLDLDQSTSQQPIQIQQEQKSQEQLEQQQIDKKAEERKAQLKKIAEKRKYSRQEIQQKVLLESFIEKLRMSVPNDLFIENQYSNSTKEDNPFQQLSVCVNPDFASPNFQQCNEVTFPEDQDKDRGFDLKSVENIDYPTGDSAFQRNSDQLKTATFSGRREFLGDDQTPTEMNRMQFEQDIDNDHDTEEQGTRKDSMDQIESVQLSNDPTQNLFKLNQVMNDSTNQKNDLADVINEQVKDIVILEETEETDIIENSGKNIPKRQSRRTSYLLDKSDSNIAYPVFRQMSNNEIFQIRKQSSNRIEAQNNRVTEKMLDRFVFDQQPNEDVDKMIQNNNEKGQKPISDDASSQDISKASSNSKSDPFQSKIFQRGNQLGDKGDWFRQESYESVGLFSKNKDNSNSDNNKSSFDKSKTPPSHMRRNQNRNSDPFVQDTSFDKSKSPGVFKRTNNPHDQSDIFVSDGQSFDLRLNNEIQPDTPQQQINVRSSHIVNAPSNMFVRVFDDRVDNQSRGGNSEGGYVNRQSGTRRNSKKNASHDSVIRSTRIPISQIQEFEIDSSQKIIPSDTQINSNEASAGLKSKKTEQRQVTIDDFKLTRKLGEGSYGKVYLANLNDKEYAIKKLSRDFLIKRSKVQSVFRERNILIEGKKCPFLPNMHHSIADEDHLYLVMEYVPNGTLEEFIKKHCNYGFKKEIVQFYAAQIVLTLEYLQEKNIAHRDIKPENIMLSSNNYIKLIDFGEAKVIDHFDDSGNSNDSTVGNLDRRSSVRSDATSAFFGRVVKKDKANKKKNKKGTFVGTSLYQAPEMLTNSQSGLYTDLWALGCIIFEMTCGKKMFGGKNASQVMEKIEVRDFKYPVNPNIDDTVKDLIDRLTTMKPLERIGLKDIDAIKNHPYFAGFNFQSVANQMLTRPKLAHELESQQADPTQVTSQLQTISTSDMLMIGGGGQKDLLKQVAPPMSADIPDVEDKQLPGMNSQGANQSSMQLNQMRENILNDMARPMNILKEEEEKRQSAGDDQQPMGKEDRNSKDQTSRIHIIQDEHQSKVLKTGIIKKRQGIMFKSYKEYEMFLLANGMILFYNTDESNQKKFQQENKAIRLQIDETMFIESYGTPKIPKKDKSQSRSKSGKRNSIDSSKMGSFVGEDVERFSIKLGNTQNYFESLKADQWPDAFKNFVWS